MLTSSHIKRYGQLTHMCISYHFLANLDIMHQSIPAVPIPSGNRWVFAHVAIPGGGAFAILSRPRGDPRVFDTSVKTTTSQEKNVRGQINMISVLRIYLLLANHSRARRHKILSSKKNVHGKFCILFKTNLTI